MGKVFIGFDSAVLAKFQEYVLKAWWEATLAGDVVMSDYYYKAMVELDEILKARRYATA